MEGLERPQGEKKKGGFHVPKIVWDLVFTLVIPYVLLAKTIPTLNFGFREVVGTVGAYVTAGLVPAFYILFDTLRTRAFNPVTLLAGSSALIGGLLAFLRVDGWVFALKDSYGSIVMASVMGGSLLLGRPFFHVFLRVALTPESPGHHLALSELLTAPAVKKALRLATAVIFTEAVVMGTVHFLINLTIVRGHFGTADFNDQIAHATAIVRPVALATSFIAYGLAFYLSQVGITRAFGPKAQLFEDTFWGAIEEALGQRDHTGPVNAAETL
ncbi:MAG TPA: VC0807 family protein [Deinococcales bacterium]|nr:VC0807 family protein [Deinococcales bacterium]